ncbi:MAG: ABC transporter permease [Burkholderiaceae bacterium]
MIERFIESSSDQLEQAMLSLGQYRLRTVMSIIGIAIGIAAVVLIGAVAQSGKAMVFDELQTFGLRSVWIYRDRRAVNPSGTQLAGSGITNDDLELISPEVCCRSISKVSPVVYGSRSATGEALTASRQGKFSRARLQGVGEAFLTINNDTVVQGRGFSRQDIRQRKAVAIIGPTIRQTLFEGSQNVVGQDIDLGAFKVQVIGVLEAKDRSFLASIGSAGGQDANTRILLPYTSFQRMQGIKDVHSLQAEAVTYEQSKTAIAQIKNTLSRQHNGRYSYGSQSMSDFVGTADRILGGVSIIGIVAAAISLLVAGLGIFNIMTTAVLERTREIGIRKALGATERSIRDQFLLEASLVSTLGGAAGLLLGLTCIWLAQWFTDFNLNPAWGVVVTAMLISVLTGVLSGLLPAIRAARLRPVQALRYE